MYRFGLALAEGVSLLRDRALWLAWRALAGCEDVLVNQFVGLLLKDIPCLEDIFD